MKVHDLATPALLAEGKTLVGRYEGMRMELAKRLGLSGPAVAVPDARTTDKLKALGYVE